MIKTQVNAIETFLHQEILNNIEIYLSDGVFITNLIDYLLKNDLSIYSFNITTPEQQDTYFAFIKTTVNNYYELYTVHFCTDKLSEHILIEVSTNLLIALKILLQILKIQVV